MWVVIICVYFRFDFVILLALHAHTQWRSVNMKFKFKGHIGKSAFFPLPPFVLQLFFYIDCWNFMAINTIIIIIIIIIIYYIIIYILYIILYYYIIILYIFVCEMETHSKGPVNTLTWLYVGWMLHHCLPRWLNIKTKLFRVCWI